ncbi:Phosphomannomutase/phosphoglucomutase [Thalassocella blandensis]|nr:Phosphomannomutase/phosphoglucomutase [Thalassocella blandensis]
MNKPKKKTSAAHKKPAKPEKKHSQKFIGGAIGFGLGMLICIELGAYLFERFVESERMARLHELAQQHVDSSAKNVEIFLNDTWGKIQRYTARPEMQRAILENNLAQEQKFASEMKSYIENVVDIKYFAFGQAALDAETFPPIRFSELEMISKVERGEKALPEAAKFDKQWLVTFVAGIPLPEPAAKNKKMVRVEEADSEQNDTDSLIASPGEKKIAGTVLVSLDVSQLLRELITRQQVSLGNMKLVQRFSSETSQNVVDAGQGNIGEAVTAEVKNSHWHVEFLPSYGMKEQVKSSMWLTYTWMIVLFLMLVATTTVAGAFVGRFIDKRKQREALITESSTPVGKTKQEAAVAGVSLLKAADILDVEINEEGENLLGLSEVEADKNAAESEQEKQEKQKKQRAKAEDDARIPPEIFRAYDIRGIAGKQITRELAELIGRALGSEATDAAQDSLIVARDARNSSPELTEYLIRGILSTGCNVINVGTVPTPLLYFATCRIESCQSGVMVTASHNPKQYNGFKVVINGKSREAEDITAIRERILQNNFYKGQGSESQMDIKQEYIDTIFSDVALAGDISIVIDAANGVTGNIAPDLFEELGCHVHPLYCDLNGEFPNHDPDPSVEKNLQDLIARVKDMGADLGVAFDGDGDRVNVVTPKGNIIWPDRLLMLFAKDILSRNPGADVVFDVKSTRHLSSCIATNGGRPIMWKTGHAPMKNKVLETGALVGGEYSGHIFIKDRWYGFDDGMYAAARLIEIISLQGQSIDDIFDEFPSSPVTPEIRVEVEEARKFDIIEQLTQLGTFEGGRVVDIDGLRVEYPFGWGLIRASNTSAHLTLRFEGDDEESLHKLKSIFVMELKKVDPSIQINWNS